ncbi:hypothetical protein MKX01_005162 [Papaver californicum]|nr:hypothetical protein MKX01_005162 [Papaver californicum]
MTDVAYAAIEKVGGANVDIAISESGWPSGQNIATIPNTRTYVNNLISHVSGTYGTLKRPGRSIEAYIFGLFNENMKDGLPTERHFGLYYPDTREIFPVTFSLEAAVVGVNYGRMGDNLPSPTAVVNLLRSKNVDRIRLFSPDFDALNALQGSGIGVVLGVPNSDVQRMGNDPSFARNWVNTNVVAFNNVQFRYISVGNEIDIPRDAASSSILPAMNNIRDALRAAGKSIPVSTTIIFSLVVDSSPPSSGRFSDGAQNIMRSIVRFLVDNRSPLLVNIYPYFSYNENRQQIALDYALFMANRVVVTDNGLQYRNLFDAMADATYTAIEKVGGSSIDIVITESGWPSGQNENIATIPNARTYVNNLISHVSGTNGTPKRPGRSIETYIFALFNENQKSGLPTEQHFGLYYPDMREIFPVTFR